MVSYISILRGINVSGHNIIKMDALKKMYTGLGYKSVQNYIQSGNVIFQTKRSKTEKLEKEISLKIEKVFGFKVPVLVKEVEEVKKVIKANPFINKRKEDVAALYVVFLSAAPQKQDVEKLDPLHSFPDEFILLDKAIYLFCPKGYGNTKLTIAFFEKKLNITATARNWKTTNELVAIAEKMKID